MERKFVSRLNQLRPAAEARKQASSQLKENIKLVVKYKYHSYGGGFRQLPSYQDTNKAFLNTMDDLEKGLGNKNLLIPEFCYEIDTEQKSENFNQSPSSLHKCSVKFEHQGWLNYRISSSSDKSFKRRYFHLRTSSSPAQSRSSSIDSRRALPANVYIMECFKEVPGQKKAENPKHQIILDLRISCVQKTPAKFGPYSFEMVESGDLELHHVFFADGQKQFDEWFSKLDQIVRKKCPNGLLPTICSSPNSTNNTFDSGNSSVKNENYQSKTEELGASLNESADSNDIRMLTNGNNEQAVTIKQSNQAFINSFDLNKYLSEKDEELQIKCEQTNLFNLYESNDKFCDEETELECIWPEKITAKKLLLTCNNFQLNLRLPPTKIGHETDKKTSRNSMNPELFYISLSLYDVKNNQKISSNFDWIPNCEQFVCQIIAQSKSSMSFLNQTKENSSTTLNSAEKNIFSLNGIDFSENPVQLLNSELKQSLFNRISKALFTVSEVHEDIYLVGRVEKILDGNSLHSSIQPYLIQMNEPSRIKAAIKLNKKIQQLMKTRLNSYRQPFAWFAKPIYKRLATSKNFDFALDNESKFVVYEQDENHLSDEDLFKYLGDFKSKDKYMNKMASLSADISIFLNDFDKKNNENQADKTTRAPSDLIWD
ncbi:Dedicator of cytokinesis [Brachionus plicatilis]|uniref:Dedicator of cytokinesis n=1 Tax=Brachionus plicatilis TaxID=10195 RepID=A0A3M7QZK1_BRAPC|nr:Dedicator of cytokinesis [Brachionus plicatilis]